MAGCRCQRRQPGEGLGRQGGTAVGRKRREAQSGPGGGVLVAGLPRLRQEEEGQTPPVLPGETGLSWEAADSHPSQAWAGAPLSCSSGHLPALPQQESRGIMICPWKATESLLLASVGAEGSSPTPAGML